MVMDAKSLARSVREFGKLSPRNQSVELERLYGGFSASALGKSKASLAKEHAKRLKAKGA